MSGESTSRATRGAERLEQAFGAHARCNACGRAVPDYRVVGLFLHDTVLVRAYCRRCYPEAAEGEYHAGGDGMLLDYAAFAARFGAPGPTPSPPTAVDRALGGLLRDPDLRRLSPPSEALARKRGAVPYRVRALFALEGASREAELTLAVDGRLLALTGHAAACARVRELLARG